MSHWITLPIILPLLTGVAMLLLSPMGIQLQRGLNLIATVSLLVCVGMLLQETAGGDFQTYALGNWPAPFGIVLVMDRLSALMLSLTAVVALFSLLYAIHGLDAKGRYFHALFQFQLMGLNGAFLTGDLFNLFVFFEVLLIASYGLLLHGGGAKRVRAGLHYVVLNLVGSTLFLVALGVLYGATGTLNMADLALRTAHAEPHFGFLLRTGALLLLVVFGLKAALLPLYFWLPGAYSNTSAPVAALFAIMTKVGIYSIIRVFTLIFGATAGASAYVATPWLLPLALATLALGTLGVLASRDLRRQIAYFVVVSVGTLLTAVGLSDTQGLSAALVYMVHTTLVTAGMFLLADIIAIQRGSVVDQPAPPLRHPLLPGVLFFLGAAALAGMPPLSGFIGKFMILKAAQGNPAMGWIWSVILVSSLLGIAALVHMGSALFWKTETAEPRDTPGLGATLLPAAMLLLCSPFVTLFGGPITDFTNAAARQLTDTQHYMESVLGTPYMDSVIARSGERSP
jgi:multicomponent K+:H+ antiporter subunit D